MLPYAPGEKYAYDDGSKGRMSRLEVTLQRSGLDDKYILIHRIHNHILFSTPYVLSLSHLTPHLLRSSRGASSLSSPSKLGLTELRVDSPSTPGFHAAKVGWKQYAKLIRQYGAEDTLINFLTGMYDISERLEMLEEYLIGVGDIVKGE